MVVTPACANTCEITILLPHTGATREVVYARLQTRLGELLTELPHPCTLHLGIASYPAQTHCEGLIAAALPAETVT